MSTPTQRSLKNLRDREFEVEVVEHWNPFARIRKDLFGFIDLLAIHKVTFQTIGVQTTSYTNIGARKKKILESKFFPIVKAAGWKIIVQGWRKNTKKRWEVKEIEL